MSDDNTNVELISIYGILQLHEDNQKSKICAYTTLYTTNDMSDENMDYVLNQVRMDMSSDGDFLVLNYRIITDDTAVKVFIGHHSTVKKAFIEGAICGTYENDVDNELDKFINKITIIEDDNEI